MVQTGPPGLELESTAYNLNWNAVGSWWNDLTATDGGAGMAPAPMNLG